MRSEQAEEQVLALAVERGLVSVADVERARLAGGSVLDALVRLGALSLEARAALVAEVAPLDPFASVAAIAHARPSGRVALPPSVVGSGFSPTGTLASAGPPVGTGVSAAARRPSERMGRGPETLGPWTLLQELGRGSNGVVYRARREVGPEVALKVMPDLLRAGPEAVARFRQEVALGRRLEHPGIVRVLDAGEAGPHAWFAMELCAGETLARRLARGRLAPEEAARLVSTVARAIGHAHARQVVHRDLKPANIMLEASGPRVTDFGLARDEARTRSLTRTGDILGTPLYMAPEQLTGQKGIDGRIDVWALGVILFECVAGVRPFGAPDTVTLARQIVDHDAPPLRARAPAAPEALEAIVRRALARDPAERWPTADALADALEAFVRGDDALPAPPVAAAPARPRRRRRRRRALVALAVAGVAALLALAGGSAALRATRRAEARRALDDLAAAPLGDDLALRAAARAAAGDDPEAQAAVVALEARRDETARARAAAAALRAALDAPDVDALPRAVEAVRAAGAAQEVAGELEFAEALLALEGPARACDGDAVRAAVARARAMVSGPARERALGAARARAADLALAAAGEGASDLRLEPLLARLDAARLLAGDDPAPRDRARLHHARTLLRRARVEQARDELTGLLEQRGDRALDETAAEALLLLARAVHELRQDAGPHLTRVAQGGPEPWRSVAEGELALLARDGARSLAMAEAALARAPDLPAALDLLARLELTRARSSRAPERYAEAEEALRRARAVAPDDAWLELWQALLRFDQGDLEGKVASLSRAVELSEPEPMLRALFWRAHTLVLLRRHAEALRDLERCRRLQPDDVEVLLWRPVCWAALGQVDRAHAEWRRLARAMPAAVDGHLRGRTATVETEPLGKGIVEAFVAEGRRRLEPQAEVPPTLARAIMELFRRSAELAPWEELAPLLAAAQDAAGDDPRGRDLAALEGARALYRRGRMDEARRLARSVIERAPNERAALEARFVEALSWLWGDDVRRGIELLGRLHADDEGPTGCSAGAAWNAFLGRSALGEVLAKASSLVEPMAVEPLIGGAYCLNDLGRLDDGLRLADEALRRVPDHIRALGVRAVLLSNQRRFADAEATLEIAVRLTEPAPPKRLLLSRAQERLNLQRYAAALEDVERVLARGGDDAEALCLRASARLATGDPGAAAADLRRARALDANGVDAWLQRLQPPVRQRLLELTR